MRAVAGVRDLRSILDTHSKWGLSGASGRLCNHTYRQRRVALFRAEAEAASRSRSGQQKQQAASRTQHRVNPSIPRRHTKYKSGPTVSNRARLRELATRTRHITV